MKRLAKEHPVFRDLPQEVQDSLAVPPGEWRDLPFNKRWRKRMKRDGVVAHVYAGPNEGHTLAKALQLCGGEPTSIMEIDVLRGPDHDMLLNQGPYAGLLRCALEGKLKALIGGPNCRSRSLLRHIPIENNPMAPRPIRRWDGEEFGIKEATTKEKAMLLEDDKLMMRFLFLYAVSNYIKKAKDVKEKTWLLLEQPADPKEKNPEVVSFWRTSQWQLLKDEFNLEEIHFNQADLGGEASKPTTAAGDLPLKLQPHLTKRKKYVSQRVHDPKSLSRWSCGFMNAVAQALLEEIFKKEPIVKQSSSRPSLGNDTFKMVTSLMTGTASHVSRRFKCSFPIVEYPNQKEVSFLWIPLDLSNKLQMEIELWQSFCWLVPSHGRSRKLQLRKTGWTMNRIFHRMLLNSQEGGRRSGGSDGRFGTRFTTTW